MILRFKLVKYAQGRKPLRNISQLLSLFSVCVSIWRCLVMHQSNQRARSRVTKQLKPPTTMSVSAKIFLLSFTIDHFSQAFTTGEPMDEDILSDVVPSNIVSRQACHKRTNQFGLKLTEGSA